MTARLAHLEPCEAAKPAIEQRDSSRGAPDDTDAEATAGMSQRLVSPDADGTKGKVAELQNLELSRRLELALSVSKVGVFEADLGTGELIWDDRTYEIYGITRSPKTLREADWKSALHPDDAAATLAAMDSAIRARGTFDVSYRIVRPGGEIRTVISRGTCFQDEHTTPRVIGADWDVSAEVALTHGLQLAKDLAEARSIELDAARARMEHQSLHDALTGLANRRNLDAVLEQYFVRASVREGLALLHIDLDGFKGVNDTIGHNGGDAVLVQVARRLEEVLGGDTFVGRFGGDEFVVCLRGGVCEEAALCVAETLKDALSRPFMVNGQTVLIGCSTGIALAPSHGTTATDLMIAADLALYRAKAAGRNASRVFVQAYRVQMLQRQSIESELRTAFDEHQFELHYQPQVELLSRKVVGAEALLRWRHPERGLLSPASFLEVLQQGPLAEPVGTWVLREASLEAAAFEHAGHPITIGVNLFSAQFLSGDLERVIKSVLDETSLRPDLLELEITESTILSDGGSLLETLTRLRRLGVNLAFDDYGTGYASLSMLKRYPLTRLKVDQSFVRHLEADGGDNAVVRAVLQLGKGFGLNVIAEGIETEGQAEILVALGCSHGQGYLFGKPMPVGRLSRLVTQGNLQDVEMKPNAASDGMLTERAGINRLKVLCVDDDADILELATMSLELDPAMDVRWASSGPSALTTAVEWQPDAILLDVMMPAMDGPSTLRHLRGNGATALIPVIFVTARAQAGDLLQYVEMGAVDVIPKPFNPMTLARVVREMVSA